MVGVGGELLQDVVELGVCLPPWYVLGLGNPRNDEVFEVGYSLGLPDLVCHADEVVVDGRVRGRPAGVGAREPRQGFGHTVCDQQVISGWLVPGSRPGQLLDMDDLADVVNGGSIANRGLVEARAG